MYNILTGILSYRLMTNAVMSKYNMHGGGQRDKLPFKATRLCHLIKCKKLRLTLLKLLNGFHLHVAILDSAGLP